MNGNRILSGSLALMLLLVTNFAALGQSQPSAKMLAANELLKEKKWAEAAKAYEEVVRSEPNNARAWYQLGMSRFSLEQFEAAIQALEKNIAISNNPIAMYNAACAHARLNQQEKALAWLTKAVNNKLPPGLDIMADSDLANLRDNAQFKELALSLDKKRRPCMYSTEARQFDFWVGEWEVFNQQDQRVGSSVIQQISMGCGILENWTDGFGGTGKSINFYDPDSAKWYQYWIGLDGKPHRYAGVYRDGALRYEREPYMNNGVRTLNRLTFFNLDANTVRQFSEQSIDDGKTWTVAYDFKYVRKQ